MSRGQRPRTPEHFPHMRVRGGRRQHIKLMLTPPTHEEIIEWLRSRE